MKRVTKTVYRLAYDILQEPMYYVDFPPTISEVAKKLDLHPRTLKHFLLSNSIPGLLVYLSVVRYRNRELPAYRIMICYWEKLMEFCQEIVDNG